MRFRLSTILLLVALVAVSVGWFADRMRRNQFGTTYLATVLAPLESAVFAPDDNIKIHGDFLDGNMLNKMEGDKPIVVVEFLKPQGDSFVIHQSGIANVDIVPEHPDRYKIEFDLSGTKPFSAGKYMLRLKCMVNGRVVVTPSRLITIKAERSTVQSE